MSDGIRYRLLSRDFMTSEMGKAAQQQCGGNPSFLNCMIKTREVYKPLLEVLIYNTPPGWNHGNAWRRYVKVMTDAEQCHHQFRRQCQDWFGTDRIMH